MIYCLIKFLAEPACVVCLCFQYFFIILIIIIIIIIAAAVATDDGDIDQIKRIEMNGSIEEKCTQVFRG